MVLIGLIGNRRVGKTTMSDYLVEKYKFKTYAYADPIKEGAKVMFNLTDEQVYGDLKEVVDERWGISPRIFLQKLGTDCCRKTFGDDVWIKTMKFWYENNKDKNIVISDIRFPNEAKAIKDMGGTLIKIVNPDVDQIYNEHESEKLVDTIQYDLMINNNNTMKDYYKKIDDIIKIDYIIS